MVAAIERLQAVIERGPSSGLGRLWRVMLIALVVALGLVGY